MLPNPPANAPTDPPLARAVVAPPPPAPVGEGERIALIDILRGVALFGILTVNMAYFSWPLATLIRPQAPWTSPLDQAVHHVIVTLATGKFYVLFSFLFGLGMSIQDRRARERAAPFAGLFSRRLLVLLLIGLVHGAGVWMGDILAAYAVIGFGLLAFRFVGNRGVLLAAAALLALELFLTAGGLALAASEPQRPAPGRPAATATPDTSPATAPAGARSPETSPTTTAASQPDEVAIFFNRLEQRALATYPGGTFLAISSVRIMEMLVGWGALASISPQILAMFLLGLYAGRVGLLASPERYRRAFVIGVALFLPAGLAVNIGMAWLLPQSQSLTSAGALLLAATQILGGPMLSFGYVSAIVLLVRAPRGGPAMWLAPVGRMALTDYLLQSVLCTLIFYRYELPAVSLGLGQYGRWGPAAGLLLTLALFACQIPLSSVWLRHFRYGPLEWLWRSLTYARVQPMRRGGGP